MIALIGLILTLALSVVPLPLAIAPFRPDWVAVVLLYWCFAAPRRFSLVTAFVLGLAVDSLSGSLLGQHAVALIVIVYLAERFYLRFRVFPLSQMIIVIMLLLALYQFLLFWIDGVAGRTVPLIERWAPVLTGTLVWLLLSVLTERRQREARALI